MDKQVGIVDEPITNGGNDKLEISAHANALMRFVEHANTPITVGIQGEWGSGKTSLINTIFQNLETRKSIKQVWINSWEHSLLSSPEEALLKIIVHIIDEIVEVDANQARAQKIKQGAEKIFKGALRIGAQMSMGMEAGKVAQELLEADEQNVAGLRRQLSEVISDMATRQSNPYERVVIYVDDLDRIEPRNAVAILELLKNIFSVERCIFVLAIDFQVVVKGLEGKFGPQTPENEWEFRAFFDKIIQLPFMMPMGQYNIGKYVNSLLEDIGFIQDVKLDETAVSRIIDLTIGGNPRSIKRLINSISLIRMFAQESQSNGNQSADTDHVEIDDRLLQFAFVCLQIAYPSIYSVITQEPNFLSWDDNFATSQTGRAEERVGDTNDLSVDQRKSLFEERYHAAQQTDDFDEGWEKALFRICYVSPRLRTRATDISKLLNFIRSDVLQDQHTIVPMAIERALRQTAITSVVSTAEAAIPLPERERAYQRRYLNGIEAFLEDGKVNHGASEAAILCMQTIHQDLSEWFPGGEFKFHGSMSVYSQKHKFFTAGFQKSRALKDGTQLQLIRHFKNEYRLPKMGTIAGTPSRTFKRGSLTSAHTSDRYLIDIPNLETYQQHRDAIRTLVMESAEMAETGWDKRLKIDYAAGTLSSQHEKILDEDSSASFPDLTSACERLLSPDYTYDVI